MISKKGFISREYLKIIAVIFMLLDHAFMTIVSNNHMVWMTWLGRIAFPIFAFQIVEGFAHTRNRRKYFINMMLFALLSEIPYNLMMSGNIFDPFEQNVLFTFLIALLFLRPLEGVWNKDSLLLYKILLSSMLCLGGFLTGTILFVDYSGPGVLTVLLIYLSNAIFKKRNLRLLAYTVSLYFINFKLLAGQVLIFKNGYEFPVQGFAICSILLFALYNGEQKLSGISGKLFKYFAYFFYPVHILILSLLSIFIIK